MQKSKMILILSYILFTAHLLLAQEKEQITVEWIYSDKSRELTAVPRFVWLDDNTAILYDGRKSEEERTFEILDPASTKRKSILDMTRAVTSLKSLIGKEDSTFILQWPISFDGDGKRALYLFKDDIYLLDLAESKFHRVTVPRKKKNQLIFHRMAKCWLSCVRTICMFMTLKQKKSCV